MPKHKTQRVGVFIDVQNLYYSAKQFYNAKVNFAHILNKAVSGRELVRAIAYVIRADIKDEHNFFDALEKIGFDVRSKDLQTFYTGAKKGDWDVGIAMDIMRMASKLDVVVLVSGDGDFKDLLEHVKALGCRAEVISFAKTTSSRLTEVADELYDLGKDLDKVLIKDFRYAQKQEALSAEKVGADGTVQNMELPTEEYINKDLQKGNFRKPFPQKPFPQKPFAGNKPFPQKPFAGNKPFQKPFAANKPFQQKSFGGNKPYQKPFEGNKPYQRPFQNFDRQDDYNDEANILQKINMDQPLLHPVAPKPAPAAQEKKEEKPIVHVQEHPKTDAAEKKPVKKAAKPAPKKKKEAAVKPAQKEPEKKGSFIERVMGKVTKKD